MSRRLPRARRHLPPRSYRSPGERREHLLSAGLVAGLQAAIVVALAVCAGQTYRMWRQGVAYLPAEIARLVPILLGLGAAVATAATLRSLRAARGIQRTPVETGRPPGEPGDGA